MNNDGLRPAIKRRSVRRLRQVAQAAFTGRLSMPLEGVPASQCLQGPLSSRIGLPGIGLPGTMLSPPRLATCRFETFLEVRSRFGADRSLSRDAGRSWIDSSPLLPTRAVRVGSGGTGGTCSSSSSPSPSGCPSRVGFEVSGPGTPSFRSLADKLRCNPAPCPRLRSLAGSVAWAG